MADPVEVIERECKEPRCTQLSVALSYAFAMRSQALGEFIDWGRANAAIRERWPKGLYRVKALAWDIYEGKRGVNGKRKAL